MNGASYGARVALTLGALAVGLAVLATAIVLCFASEPNSDGRIVGALLFVVGCAGSGLPIVFWPDRPTPKGTR